MPVDYDVLKYLLGRSQKAYYMEKQLAYSDSTISIQQKIITNKDSLITNRNDALQVCEAEKEITQLEVEGLTKENKSIKKKVSFFKFTTIGAVIIGSISTIYFIIH